MLIYLANAYRNRIRGDRADNREQEVAGIARAAKRLHQIRYLA